MEGVAQIDSGFAEVEAGLWLMGRSQPAAFFGTAVRHRRKGWRVCDRSRLDLVETTGAARCADASRPFLTHIPCAAPIFAVSDKVLVAPASARRGAQLVKAVPMTFRNALCVTAFGIAGEDQTAKAERREDGLRPSSRQSSANAWVVMATAGRTARVSLAEDEVLSARPETIVAWTGRSPTGFCPRLSVWDVLLPRGPRDLLFTFYGPGIVWIEGAGGARLCAAGSAGARGIFGRRGYGV